MTIFPSNGPSLYLAYVGMETDLIFTQGVDLPGFASFPLLETAEGRAMLLRYFTDQLLLATRHKFGAVLEAPTWMANADRAAPLGYSKDDLTRLNRAAISLLRQVRAEFATTPAILSANIGPRDDAYAPSGQMTALEASDYHVAQISSLIGTGVDVISGYTLAYASEAAGIAMAAEKCGFPSVISFTVETDGRLPTGQPLDGAIDEVDRMTGAAPAYFMINCAHPDHFSAALLGSGNTARIGGVVANASRCSHAELDNAETLDSGDPAELGHQMAALRSALPKLRVLGGCCGTDLRHLESIARSVGNQI